MSISLPPALRARLAGRAHSTVPWRPAPTRHGALRSLGAPPCCRPGTADDGPRQDCSACCPRPNGDRVCLRRWRATPGPSTSPSRRSSSSSAPSASVTRSARRDSRWRTCSSAIRTACSTERPMARRCMRPAGPLYSRCSRRRSSWPGQRCRSPTPLGRGRSARRGAGDRGSARPRRREPGTPPPEAAGSARAATAVRTARTSTTFHRRHAGFVVVTCRAADSSRPSIRAPPAARAPLASRAPRRADRSQARDRRTRRRCGASSSSCEAAGTSRFR